jgi:toxin-antitoxin system PIN domain toxin
VIWLEAARQLAVRTHRRLGDVVDDALRLLLAQSEEGATATLYAHRTESPRAVEHRDWLHRALGGDEPFGVSESVLSSFLRIVTHHRIYREPTPPDVALSFCRAVLAAPAAVAVRPGPRHWLLFSQLCQTVGARGNQVPDATWVTTDRGFARFPGLRLQTPLD